MYGGVGEALRGDGECVGEDLEGQHVADGGESVCCVIVEACRCCSPLESRESLDGVVWMGLAMLESCFEDEDGDKIVGVEE